MPYEALYRLPFKGPSQLGCNSSQTQAAIQAANSGETPASEEEASASQEETSAS